MEVFKIKVSVYFCFCSDLFIYQKTEQFEIGLIFLFNEKQIGKMWKTIVLSSEKIFFETIIVHYLILKNVVVLRKKETITELFQIKTVLNNLLHLNTNYFCLLYSVYFIISFTCMCNKIFFMKMELNVLLVFQTLFQKC